MKLSSPVFNDGGQIATRYTGDGEDFSPPLKWTGIPESAQELVLICDDPDAPSPEPWVHWLIYGMSASATNGLPEHIPTEEKLEHPLHALQGKNSFNEIGYRGPLPPVGHGVHHYHFKLYALDTKLHLKPKMTKNELLSKIKGHVLSEAELIGTYKREATQKAG